MSRRPLPVIVLAFLAPSVLHAQDEPAAVRSRPIEQPPPEPEFTPDEVVVGFRAGTGGATRAQIAAAVGGRWVDGALDQPFDVVRVPPGRVASAAQWLEQIPAVEYAEPNFLYHAFTTPSDPLFKRLQFNLYDHGQPSHGVPSRYGVAAPSAWQTTTGEGTIVAIVDTGVAYENYQGFVVAPDLKGQKFVSPRNFVSGSAHANDDNGHGTHVCGTVAQRTNNRTGCAGIAFKCHVMPVKVLDANGTGTNTQIASGIYWAADHGAHVINLSLGGASKSTTLKKAVDYAWAKGCVICAASGNDAAGKVSYPAAFANCIAIGATDFDGNLAWYSNYGSALDVVAPGGDLSADLNQDGLGDGIVQNTFDTDPTRFDYYLFEGTSMATPHVAAIAALVKSAHPAYTNAQVRDAIERTAMDRGAVGKDNHYGFGIVDAALAVRF